MVTVPLCQPTFKGMIKFSRIFIKTERPVQNADCEQGYWVFTSVNIGDNVSCKHAPECAGICRDGTACCVGIQTHDE